MSQERPEESEPALVPIDSDISAKTVDQLSQNSTNKQDLQDSASQKDFHSEIHLDQDFQDVQTSQNHLAKPKQKEAWAEIDSQRSAAAQIQDIQMIDTEERDQKQYKKYNVMIGENELQSEEDQEAQTINSGKKVCAGDFEQGVDQNQDPQIKLVDQKLSREQEKETKEEEEKVENMQERPEIMLQIQANCTQITKEISQSHEPTKLMLELNQLLENESQIVIKAIRVSSEWSDQFFGSIRGVVQAVLNERVIMNAHYLKSIFGFFRALLVFYLSQLPECGILMRLIDDIFDQNSSLYTAIAIKSQYQTQNNRPNGGSNQAQQILSADEKKRKDNLEELNLESEQYEYQRQIEESDWRMTLQAGDYIDAMSEYETPSSNQYQYIRGWTPAKITEIDENRLMISFIGRKRSSDQVYTRDSIEIAPKNTFTSDLAWKMELKEGDLLDSCDEFGVWYRSTLLRRFFKENELDCEGNMVEYFQIGCRYPDPNGTKTNKEGIKVTGFLNSEWDLVTEVHAPSSKHFKAYTTQYLGVNESDLRYDLKVSDQEDLVYYSSKINRYAVHRQGQNGNVKVIGDYIDEFGHQGGFQRILDFFDAINEGKVSVSAKHLGLLITFLQRTLPLWTREFMCQYTEILVEKLQNMLGSKEQTNPVVSVETKSQITVLVNNYHMLLRRYYVPKSHHRMFGMINARIGATLLQLENLEKRIIGIKLISEQIWNMPYLSESAEKQKEVVADLIQLNVFEVIFSSKNFHSEIVTRADEVLKLYANTGQLSFDLVDLLWETSQADESARIQIHKMIVDCADAINQETIQHLIEKICQINPQYLTLKDLDFISQVAMNKRNLKQIKESFTKMLKQICFQEKEGYSAIILKPARKRLQELLHSYDVQQRVQIAMECFEQIENQKQSKINVIKVFRKAVSLIPKRSMWGTQIDQTKFCRSLLESKPFFEIIAQDLQRYKEKVLQIWGKQVNQDNIEKLGLFEEGYTHWKNIEERIKLITLFLEFSDNYFKIGEEQLMKIWNILLINPIFGDQNLFFRWLRRVLTEPNWLSSQDMCNFFAQKVERNAELVQGLRLDGFLCLKTMFLKVNEVQNLLNITKQPKSEDLKKQAQQQIKLDYLGFAQSHDKNTNDKQSVNESGYGKENVEFRVHVDPNQLRGIELFWQIFRESCLNLQQNQMQQQVISFLTKIHMNTSSVYEDHSSEIIMNFTKKTLNLLENQWLVDPNISVEAKQCLVQNSLTMIMQSVQDSERQGTALIRPHYCFFRPVNMVQIFVSSYIIKEGCPKHLVFKVDSSMTLWELLFQIAQKIDLSPLKIRLNRHESNAPPLNAENFGKTLDQVQIGDGDELTAIKISSNIPRVPLINPLTQEMVKELEIVISRWFDAYSTQARDLLDLDEEHLPLDGEKSYMTMQNCADFMLSTLQDINQNSFQTKKIIKITPESKSIIDLFQNYGTVIDNEENELVLKKDDFLRFYRDKSISAPNIVWQNLESHQIGRDLSPEQTDTDFCFLGDKRVCRNQKNLPRYQLSADKENFSTLINLEMLLQDRQSDLMTLWQTIGQLKTNPNLFFQLLHCDQLYKQLSYDDSQEKQSQMKLLYSLQIVAMMVGSYDNKRQGQISSYYDSSILQSSLENLNKIDIQPPLGNVTEEFKEEQKDLQENIRNLEGDHWYGVNKDQDQRRNQQYKNTRDTPNNQDSSTPIALPDAATVASQKQQNQQKELGMGAAEQKENLSLNKRRIKEWKGKIVDEKIYLQQVTDQELVDLYEDSFGETADRESKFEKLHELKTNWIANFIEKDGFSLLLQIMEQIVDKNKQNQPGMVFENQIEAIILNQTAYLIQIILVSCFCSQSEDKQLAGILQRKVSLKDDAEMVDSNQQNTPEQTQPVLERKISKENEMLVNQKEVTADFSNLIDVLSYQGTSASKLIQKLDLQRITILLQTTLELIVRKQDRVNVQDQQIASECLNIWISCISFDNTLIQKLYYEVGSDSHNRGDSFVKLLVNDGLFAGHENLRLQFKTALSFMCYNIKQHDLPMVPSLFFLQKLVKQLDFIFDIHHGKTSEYFALLTSQINNYFLIKKTKPFLFQESLDVNQLIKKVIDAIDKYQSAESTGHSAVDNTLVGLLHLGTALLKANPNALDSQESGIVLNLLVNKCLFNKNQTPFSGHITDLVNLKSFGKESMNKCHSMESRQAAYELLDQIIIASKDKTLVDNLVTQFWGPYIAQMDFKSQEIQSGEPSDRNRSSFGFAGLRNLGCICYMNAMIQQMYHVPAFRNSLCAANDLQKPDMQEDKDGRHVDNNQLHQWLRMFSFLSLTDRQEYNPKDFCFAFKQPGGLPTNVRVQQDAQEFMNVGFDRLETMLKGTPQKYLCQNTFQGQTTSLTVCRNCGNINFTNEDFYMLPLSVKNKKTLDESLESLVAGEIIEDYNCSACNQKVAIEKKNALKSLPNTLIVHLNRIVFDFDTMRNVKLNDKLEFPNQLNLKKYQVAQVLEDQRKKMNEERREKLSNEKGIGKSEASQQNSLEDHKVDDSVEMEGSRKMRTDDQQSESQQKEINRIIQEGLDMRAEEFDYKLVGVVIHMGTADAGHYLSYINIERDASHSSFTSQNDPNSQNKQQSKHQKNSGSQQDQWVKTEDQMWLEFNDSTVSHFDFSKLKMKAFGESQDKDGKSGNLNGNNGMVLDQVGGDEMGNHSGATITSDGAQRMHNAYMLIYEKAEKKPMRIVCPEKAIRLILDQPLKLINFIRENPLVLQKQTIEDNQDELNKLSEENFVMYGQICSFLEQLPHSFLIYPHLITSIYDKFADKNAKEINFDQEITMDVNFDRVTNFIANEYYRQVHADNELFLAEKQVVSNPFFGTTINLLSQLVSDYQEKQDLLGSLSDQQAQTIDERYLMIYNILDKLIFEMLINATEHKHLSAAVNLLLQVVNKSRQALETLIQSRVLQGVENAQNFEEKVFFDMLMNHRFQEVRDAASQILSNICLSLFEEIISDTSQNIFNGMDNQSFNWLELILKVILDMVTREVQKTWHKAGALFDFIFSLIEDREAKKIDYLSKLGFLRRILELVSRYKSELQYVAPPFDKLIQTLHMLVCSQPQIIYLYGISDQYQPTENDLRNEIRKNGQTSPFFLDHKAGDGQQISESNQLITFNPIEIKYMSLIEKNFKDIFNTLLRNSQQEDALIQILGHLCWKNREFSRRYGKQLLKGLNAISEYEIKPYLKAMVMYLGIQDEFQPQRIEWLLGIPNVEMKQSQNQLYNDSFKIGVARLDQVDDSNVQYNSSLFSDQNNFRESVLTMLYHYRKQRNFERTLLLLLDSLLQVAVSSDPKQHVLKYLLTIDPPSYIARRYWDWLEPFVKNHVQTCIEFQANVSYQEEMQICFTIINSIETLQTLHPQLINAGIGTDYSGREESARQNLGYPLMDPYMIWEMQSDRQFCIKLCPDTQNSLTFHEVTVQVSKSRPTGTSNESIERIWSGNRANLIHKKAKSANSAQKVTQKESSTTGTSNRLGRQKRRQNLRQRKQQRQTGRSGVGVGGRGRRIIDEGDAQYELSYDEKNSSDEEQTNQNDQEESVQPEGVNLVENEQDSSWAEAEDQESQRQERQEMIDAAAQMVEDAEKEQIKAEQSLQNDQDRSQAQGGVVPELDHPSVLQDKNSPDKTNKKDQEGVTGIPQGRNLDQTDIVKDKANITDQDLQNQENLTEQYPSIDDQSTQVQNEQIQDESIFSGSEQHDSIEDFKVPKIAVLVIMFNNKHRYLKSKVTLVFDQSKRNQCNFRVPLTDYSLKVASNLKQFVLKFHKLNLDEDWGEFDHLRFVVDGRDTETGQIWNHWQNDYLELRSEKMALMQADANAQALEYQNENNLIGGEAASGFGINQANDDGGFAQSQNGANEGHHAFGASTNGEVDNNFGGGEISCPACTFANPPTNEKCEICETQLFN